jgi:putative hydrolase of the HAD superfamily
MGDAKNAWVIFDADNTLWAIEHLYDAARQKMCEYLGCKGIDPSTAEQYQRARDKLLHATYGYSACRFARSFEDTLLHFLPNVVPEDVCHIRRLALDVFEQRALLADGLEEVLFQVSSTYQMGIITAGERWVQERRLADFHLRDRFLAIEIVESKSEAVFRSFAEGRGIDPERSWVVGDSYRSDILPAKAAGFRTILLDTSNWVEVESQQGLRLADAVIKSLKELARILGLIPPQS